MSLGLAPLRRGQARWRSARRVWGDSAAACADPALLDLDVRPPLAGATLRSWRESTFLSVSLVGGAGLWTGRLRSERSPRVLPHVRIGAPSFRSQSFVFGSPYAAVAGMTMAHGLQYLLLIGLVAAGQRAPVSDGWGRPRAVHALAVLGGVVPESDFSSAR